MRAGAVNGYVLVMICTTLIGICILTTSSPVSTFCLISSVLGFMGAAHSVQTVEDSQQFLKPHVKKGFRDRGKSKTVMHNDSNLTVSVWQDNRPVVVIASNSDPTVSTSVTRKNKNKKSQTVSCPSAVALYNKCMGGVDRNDQLRGRN